MIDYVNSSIPQDVDETVHECRRTSRRSLDRGPGRLRVQSQQSADGYQPVGIQKGHYLITRFREALWLIQAQSALDIINVQSGSSPYTEHHSNHRSTQKPVMAAGTATGPRPACPSLDRNTESGHPFSGPEPPMPQLPVPVDREDVPVRVPCGPSPAHLDTPAGDAVTGREIGQLLYRADQGDPNAWEQILSRYSGVVWAAVRSFRLQHADALDVVQTTWLRLAENLHRIQHPERLGGWLTTTANRECLHILYRAQRITTVPETVLNAAADPAAGPEQQAVNSRTVHLLWQLIATLPPRQRQVLQELFTEQPPSYTELAARIDIPVGSIGPIRRRALGRIRRMLHDHDRNHRS